MKWSKPIFFTLLPFLLILSTPSLSQKLEGLMEELKNASSQSEKASLSYKIALEYVAKQSYSKAISYLITINEQEVDPDLAQKVLYKLSVCYENTDDHANAIAYQKTLLEQLKEKKEDRYPFHLERLLYLYIKYKSYKDALAVSDSIIPYFEKNKDYTKLAKLYNNMGYMYKSIQKNNIAIDYFKKCFTVLSSQNTKIEDDEKIALFLNLSVVYLEMGDPLFSTKLIQDAKEASIAAKDSAEYYKVLSYEAVLDIKAGNSHLAVEKLISVIAASEKTKNRKSKVNIQNASKILSDHYYQNRNIIKYRQYNDIYNAVKDELLTEERNQNKLLIAQQIDIEKSEYELRKKLVETEKNELVFKKTELENENNKKNLLLKQAELDVVTESEKTQKERLRNEALEKDNMKQLLSLSMEKIDKEKLSKELFIQKKETEIQELELSKRKKENIILEMQHRSEEANLHSARKVNFWATTAALLLAVVCMAVVLFLNRYAKQNSVLYLQQKIVKEQSEEIMSQNEELSEKNNELGAISKMLKDVNETLEKRVEERTLELSKSNEELIDHVRKAEQFTFIVSHNLRGPFSRMKGLLKLFHYHNIEDPSVTEIIDKLDISMQDLENVIADLNVILRIKKGTEGMFSTFDLAAMVDRIRSNVAEDLIDAKGEFYVNLTGPKQMNSVKPYVESIIYNLVNNAIKYRSPDRPLRIELNAENTFSHLRLSIRDNGIGIDRERYKEKLFGLYQRFHVHVEGKGMGLFLIKTQAEALQGHVSLESEVGAGTIFTVVLPHQKTTENV